MMGRLKHGALFVFCFSFVTLLFFFHTLGNTNEEAGEAPSLISDILSLGSNVNSAALEKAVTVNQFCGYQVYGYTV